ncbi:MAG: sel1 repeat family protein [Candidatus Cloacimonetes bacterium]|nr:sel1 repeat family protein [Candidatus Cloacimonadota bacterium]
MSFAKSSIVLILRLFICNTIIFSQNSKIDLIKKFADKKIAWAQYELSNLYYEGKTIEKSETLSFKYMLESAKQGYNKASYGLGVYLNTGIGCETNKIKALAWMIKSYDSGYLRAKDYIDRLQQELSPEDMELAQNILKRTLSVNISPKWVYIKSKDNKIKTNSKGESSITLEAFLYSKKQLSFSKSGYISQNIEVEFGKDDNLNINLTKVDASSEMQSQSIESSISVTNNNSTSTNWIYY